MEHLSNFDFILSDLMGNQIYTIWKRYMDNSFTIQCEYEYITYKSNPIWFHLIEDIDQLEFWIQNIHKKNQIQLLKYKETLQIHIEFPIFGKQVIQLIPYIYDKEYILDKRLNNDFKRMSLQIKDLYSQQVKLEPTFKIVETISNQLLYSDDELEKYLLLMYQNNEEIKMYCLQSLDTEIQSQFQQKTLLDIFEEKIGIGNSVYLNIYKPYFIFKILYFIEFETNNDMYTSFWERYPYDYIYILSHYNKESTYSYPFIIENTSNYMSSDGTMYPNLISRFPFYLSVIKKPLITKKILEDIIYDMNDHNIPLFKSIHDATGLYIYL